MSRQKTTKNYTMDMCEGSIIGKMLLFALPLIASSILQLLFNAADVIVVGKFAGDNALAAVGSTSSIINLLTNGFIGLSVGANVLVARYFAGKQEKQLRPFQTLKEIHDAGLFVGDKLTYKKNDNAVWHITEITEVVTVDGSVSMLTLGGWAFDIADLLANFVYSKDEGKTWLPFGVEE